MKNKLYKSIMVWLVIIVFLVNLVGCGPSTHRPDGDSSNIVDTTKTQLRVSNYNGAFGGEWLKKAGERFSQMVGDKSFEDGKKGVQVIVDPAKVTGSAIISSMDNSPNDIFFTERVYYYDLVSSGKALDLTDMITEKLTKYGENKSIYDKLIPQQQEYYGVIENDEKKHYYVVPHYQSFRCITYDVDLFNDEGFFFAADTSLDANINKTNIDYDNGNDGFILGDTDKKSNGPDGQPGTYDDGLPATYDDFYRLCDKISNAGISPLLYPGKYQLYFTEFLSAMAADYEGAENMQLNFNFNGTAKNLACLNANGTVKLVNGKIQKREPLEIKPSNGYMLATQAGKYYALQFAEKLIRTDGYLDPRSLGSSLTHTDAQKEYLYANFESTCKDIAMLIESNYWENEADDMGYFDAMAKRWPGKAERTSRNFAVMPYPKATVEQVGEGVTIMDYQDSAGFINKNIPEYKKQLALDFLQFVCTDESLIEFTTITGCTRALNYPIENEEYFSKLSPYTQSVLNMMHSAKKVYTYSNADIFKYNASNLSFDHYWRSEINLGQGKQLYTVPSKAMQNSNKITSEIYFNGMIEQEKNIWSGYSEYFEK